MNNATQRILSSFFFKYAGKSIQNRSRLTFREEPRVLYLDSYFVQFFSPLAKVKDEQQNRNLEIVNAKDGHRAKDSFINMAAGANVEVKHTQHTHSNHDREPLLPR